MKEIIEKTTSFEAIKEFFKMKEDSYVANKNDLIITDIISLWERGILQEKLKSLGKPDLATQINEINKNQKESGICRDIFNIILNRQKRQSETSSSSKNSILSFLDDLLSGSEIHRIGHI